jgi:hypothetical protein
MRTEAEIEQHYAIAVDKRLELAERCRAGGRALELARDSYCFWRHEEEILAWVLEKEPEPE